MQLSEVAIEELKRILRSDYGAEISDCQANELGEKLLKLTALAIKHRINAPEITKGRGPLKK